MSLVSRMALGEAQESEFPRKILLSSRHRPHFSVWLWVGIMLGWSFPAWGYERIVVDEENGSYLFWEDAAIPVLWHLDQDGSDDLDFALLEDALKGSFRTWQNVDCSYFAYRYGGTVDKEVSDFNAFSREDDGVNLLIFSEDEWPAEWDGAIAITVPMFYPNSGRVLEIDMIFNGLDFSWSTDPGGVSGYMDVANIATHEVGHFLGLDHSDDLSATMYYSTTSGLTGASTLSADDIQGVCAVYPVEGKNGSSCEKDDDCSWGLCVEHEASGGKVCASTCQCDTDCSAYLTCQSGYCLPPVAGDRAMGEPCRDMLECQADLACVVNAIGEEGYCTRECSTESPCPDDWFCQAANVGYFCASLDPKPLDGLQGIEITDVSIDPEAPRPGDAVLVSVSVKKTEGVEAVEYRFFSRHQDDWSVLQEYGETSYTTFLPKAVGNWELRVEVREVGSEGCYDKKEVVGVAVMRGEGEDDPGETTGDEDQEENSSYSDNGGCFGRQMGSSIHGSTAEWLWIGCLGLWILARRVASKVENRQEKCKKIKN